MNADLQMDDPIQIANAWLDNQQKSRAMDDLMQRDEIDILWSKALGDAIKDGEQFTRYHFAALVAKKAVGAEREACAALCEAEGLLWGQRYAAAIRARR